MVYRTEWGFQCNVSISVEREWGKRVVLPPPPLSMVFFFCETKVKFSDNDINYKPGMSRVFMLWGFLQQFNLCQGGPAYVLQNYNSLFENN